MTDLPPLPVRIGFDRRRIVRSALAFLLLATVAATLFTLVQRVRPSLLGGALASRSLGPVPLSFALVEGAALLVIVVTLGSAWQRRDFVVLRDDALEFHNDYGAFRVEWANVERLERAPAGYVGIKLRDRERLLATHAGTAEQRERLATLEPFSGYDLILHPEELSCGAGRFVAWVDALRARSSRA